MSNFIRLIMKESVLINAIVYFVYLIILSMLGISIGFLLGMPKHEDEINPLLLLFLLKIICNNRFNSVLLEYFHNLSLETKIVEPPFSKFSLKSIKQMDPRPLKLILKEPEELMVPFLIIEDPILSISLDTEILWDESTSYQFELFEFYQHINQKI